MSTSRGFAFRGANGCANGCARMLFFDFSRGDNDLGIQVALDRVVSFPFSQRSRRRVQWIQSETAVFAHLQAWLTTMLLSLLGLRVQQLHSLSQGNTSNDTFALSAVLTFWQNIARSQAVMSVRRGRSSHVPVHQRAKMGCHNRIC